MKSAVAALLMAAVLAGCGNSSHAADPPRTTTTTALGTGGTAGRRVSANYVAPVVTIQLAQPLAHYTVYVDDLLTLLHGQLATLHAAALRGDLSAAEADWSTAHFTWLELGQDDSAYGAFGELGQQIDGMAAGLPHTVHSPAFTGFHRIELDLWGHHSGTAAAADIAHLAVLVRRLRPAEVQRDLPLTALGVDAWVLRCHEILEDALRDSLSQNDDYGSNSDLGTLAADVNATHEMLAVLAPLIEARRPKIVPSATTDLRVLTREIEAAGGPAAHRNLRAMPLRQRQALEEATGAAVETLAPVSEILQVTVPGS
ncbi:MAG TPA: EfeM/EfeO family lipoprotein [Solirubrobacteraceae bacterium]|nr:EfeM/EfeO family lipoprotein [Solirubrobacteraceae bacterium]